MSELDILSVYVAPEDPILAPTSPPPHSTATATAKILQASTQASGRSNVAIDQVELTVTGTNPGSSAGRIEIMIRGEMTSGSIPRGGAYLEGDASHADIKYEKATVKCSQGERVQACYKWHRVTHGIDRLTGVYAYIFLNYTHGPVAFDGNGVNLLVALPQVTVGFNSKSEAERFRSKFFPPLGVSTSYNFPGAGDYDWGEVSSSPVVATNSVAWDQTPGNVTNESGYNPFPDSSTAISTTESGRISVTNPGAIRDDNTDSFIAGGLLGVGGGAAISFIDIIFRKIDGEEDGAGESVRATQRA